MSTAGIELTVIDAVAMSPCTPPSILEWMRGDPSISTESYDSGAPRYASRCSRMQRLPFHVADAVLDDPGHVTGIDRQQVALDRLLGELRLRCRR